jgi:hypothetical protein
VIPWFDRHHYPSSTDPFVALRNQLIRCRHVVYFITPHLLKQGRGWCAVERSYAELMQRHFECAAQTMWNLEVPLIFAERNDERLARSIWAPLLQKARWFGDRRAARISKIDWAVSEIQLMLQQQHAQIDSIASHIKSDASLNAFIGQYPGLDERLVSRLPDPLN